VSQDPVEATVQLVLHEEEPDPDELEELTAKLRRQLLELDVDAVERPPVAEAPAGTKGLGIAIGALILKMATSPELLSGVVTTIRRWLSGHRNRSVKIAMDGDTIELTGVSSEEQDKLADAWIARHTPS
jgi:hypothetical protein